MQTLEWHKAVLEIDFGEGEDEAEQAFVAALKKTTRTQKTWAKVPAGARFRVVPLQIAGQPVGASE